MTTTYIQRHVARTNRNLLVVNGGILLLLALFTLFIMVGMAALHKQQNNMQANLDAINGSDVLGESTAVDLSHPTSLSAGEVDEAKLRQLEGQVVTLSAPQVVDLHMPVARWSERATGKTKPQSPPTYFVLQTAPPPSPEGAPPSGPPPGMVIPRGVFSPFGGPSFVIIPPDYVQPSQKMPSFTGVVRALPNTDRTQIVPALQGHDSNVLSYELDCLNVGAHQAAPQLSSGAGSGIGFGVSPLFLALFGGLLGLSLWNISKAVRRAKNLSLHPVYAQLARYGTPADIERHIEADYQRGVRSLSPADLTSMWLLAGSFWGLDVVPLSYIVWVYRPRKVAFRGNLLRMLIHSIVATHTLIFLDRLGKQHVVRAADGQLNQIMSAVTQGRPWMETGAKSPLRQQFGMDKAGFIAAVEARRQQMTAQPTGYTPPPTQPQWVGGNS